MIEHRLSEDWPIIRALMTHPGIFSHINDDMTAPVEKFQPDKSGRMKYLLSFANEKIVGMFALEPRTALCWEVHSLFLPSARGIVAREAYKAGMRWLRENTSCRKVLGFIPADNRPALVMAKQAGLKVIGIDSKSILRGGIAIDRTIVGAEL